MQIYYLYLNLTTVTAQKIADHAKEVLNNGGTYCDCPACTKALEIIKELEK